MATLQVEPIARPDPVVPDEADTQQQQQEQQQPTKRYWNWLDARILAALMVFAAVLRVIGIGTAYDVTDDEPFYLGLGASVRHGHLPPHVPSGYGNVHQTFLLHPPGFFILVALWQSVTGTAGNIFHQIYVARGVNVVLAVLTIALLYALGRRLGGRWIGVAVAVLAALDPYILRQNGHLLLETSTLFWIVGGYYVLIGISQGRYRRPRLAAVGTGVLFGVACLTTEQAAVETAGALIVLFALNWGIPRRLAALSALAAVLTYSTYLILCVAEGLAGSLWSAKSLGLQRMLGLVQITGFNRPGSTALTGTLWSEVVLYGSSYVLIGLGTIGAVFLLRSRRGDYRILGVFVASAAVLLGYAVLFGTIEEQLLYFLAVPAVLSVVIAAAELHRRAVLRAFYPWKPRAVLILGVGAVFLWSLGAWAHTRTTPDNGNQHAVAWLDAHASRVHPVAVTTSTEQYTLWATGLSDVALGSPAQMAADNVRYVILSSRLTDLNYASSVTRRRATWYMQNARRVYSFNSPSQGTLGIYQTTNPAVW